MANKVFTHYYDSLACSMRDVDALREWIKGQDVVVDNDTCQRTILHDATKIRQEGDFLISRDEDRLHLCFSQEEVITVPDGVRSIAAGAFTHKYCPNVRHIILPESVDGISPYAFCCDRLNQISVNNKYVYISDAAFEIGHEGLAIHMMEEFTYIVTNDSAGLQVVKQMPYSEYSSYVYAKENDLPF